MRLVWRLLLLLKRTHEPPPRDHARLDLGQMDLHHQTFLPSVNVADLRDAITWPTNLEEDLALHVRLRRGDLQLRVFHVFCGTTRKIRLVLLSLRVREVGTLIGVECQA